jgi:hypothetical protein
MKISIDGILGTAKKINNQRELEESNFEKKKSGVKADSVSIGTRINSRLDAIETEFKEIQSSLTKNQMIRDGIEQLNNDLAADGRQQQNILKSVTFEGKEVLRSFVGNEIAEPVLKTKRDYNAGLINSDVNRLKKLQVELDNITASNLAGSDRLKNMMSNIDSIFSRSNMANLENISSIKADAVMRLIK